MLHHSMREGIIVCLLLAIFSFSLYLFFVACFSECVCDTFVMLLCDYYYVIILSICMTFILMFTTLDITDLSISQIMKLAGYIMSSNEECHTCMW